MIECACPNFGTGQPSDPDVARAGHRPQRLDSQEQIEILARDVGPLAFKIALNMLGNRADAEDALSDAYLRAYRGWANYRGEASPKTWFIKIVVNSCRKHRRLWRRLVLGNSDLSESPDQVGTVYDTHGDPGLRGRLQSAIIHLPHRQKTAFILRYLHDFKIVEIAGVMNCAPGTVKATIHKAVVKLREELREIK